jgi:hypothetical protein
MARDVTGALAQRRAAMGVLHHLPVAEKLKQRRHFGHPGIAQNQTLGNGHTSIITQAFSARESLPAPLNLLYDEVDKDVL